MRLQVGLFLLQMGMCERWMNVLVYCAVMLHCRHWCLRKIPTGTISLLLTQYSCFSIRFRFRRHNKQQQWRHADNHRSLRGMSHFLLQKLAWLLILIETDNQETDAQPPAALPSACPLPAASGFQQMPELIRAAYVSTRSYVAILKQSLPKESCEVSLI